MQKYNVSKKVSAEDFTEKKITFVFEKCVYPPFEQNTEERHPDKKLEFDHWKCFCSLKKDFGSPLKWHILVGNGVGASRFLKFKSTCLKWKKVAPKQVPDGPQIYISTVKPSPNSLEFLAKSHSASGTEQNLDDHFRLFTLSQRTATLKIRSRNVVCSVGNFWYRSKPSICSRPCLSPRASFWEFFYTFWKFILFRSESVIFIASLIVWNLPICDKYAVYLWQLTS